MQPSVEDIMNFEMVIFDNRPDSSSENAERISVSCYQDLNEAYNLAVKKWQIENVEDISVSEISAPISSPVDYQDMFTYLYNNWNELYWLYRALLSLDISVTSIDVLLQDNELNSLLLKIDHAVKYIINE